MPPIPKKVTKKKLIAKKLAVKKGVTTKKVVKKKMAVKHDAESYPQSYVHPSRIHPPPNIGLPSSAWHEYKCPVCGAVHKGFQEDKCRNQACPVNVSPRKNRPVCGACEGSGKQSNGVGVCRICMGVGRLWRNNE